MDIAVIKPSDAHSMANNSCSMTASHISNITIYALFLCYKKRSATNLDTRLPFKT